MTLDGAPVHSAIKTVATDADYPEVARAPHEPQGIGDFLRLLFVCTAPTTAVCALLGYSLHGSGALWFFTVFGLLIGTGATLFGWRLARYLWAKQRVGR